MFLIAAGYEDADDCDALRADPAFKLALGRLPETGPALCARLIKLAARIVETAARIRIRLPSVCPDKALWRLLAGRFAAAP